MTKSEEPLVSIIMNCYQGEKYLQIAIESVLAQTYHNWELIFWDNQSTDSSAEIFKDYNDERFKYFYAPKHTRLSEARNYAIDEASGDYFAFLDVDDWWEAEKLEKQIPLFNDTDVGLVYGNYWFVNEKKKTNKLTHKKELPTGFILDELLSKYVVGLLTLVVRRQAFINEPNVFNPKYHIIGDYDLVIRLAVQWKILCIQQPIAHYRWHENNETNKYQQRHIDEQESWYKTMRQHSAISLKDSFKKQENKIMYMKAIIWFENHRYIDAATIFLRLPICVWKLKLFFILIMPRCFVKHFTNY